MKTVTMYRPGNLGSVRNVLNDFDRYLESFFGDSVFNPVAGYTDRRLNFVPAVDIRETGEAYYLEAELPGFDEKNVEVRLDGDTLTIESRTENGGEKGEKARPVGENAEKNRETYLLRERRSTSFSRSFKLPDNADRDSVTASFKNGILCLEIKKAAESKKKVIRIETT